MRAVITFLSVTTCNCTSNLKKEKYILSGQGNSEENTEVVIRYDKDNERTSIRIEAEGIDGNVISYIVNYWTN